MTEQPNGRTDLPRTVGLGREALRAVAAVAAVALALGLRELMVAAFGPQPPFIIFYPTVMVVALLMGLAPGLLATVLAVLATQYWILPPRGEWKVAKGEDVAALAIFAGAGAFVSAMAMVHHRTRRRAAAMERVIDVTEQKATMEKLAAERERLEVTLRSIGDAVIATDAACRITVLNAVAETLTGWTSAEAIGRPLHDVFRIVSEETGRPAEDPVGKVLREGVVAGLANHTRLIARDGRELPIADSAAPIRDGGGTVVGVVLVFRDQTGERRAERALREEVEAKRQLASMALNVPGAIYSFRLRPDGSACMPSGTPAVDEIFGFPRPVLAEDMAPVFAAVHPEDLESLQDGIREADRALTPWHSQFRYHHPAGGLRWVEAWSLPHREPDGGSLWQGFLMDITERKRAELALAENEALYRSLFQLAPSGVVLLDEAGRIAAFNDEACRQLGYTRTELGRLSVWDINLEESDPAVMAAHLVRIAEAGGDEFVARHRTKEGAVRQILVSSRPVQFGGSGHFLAVWKDITEQRQAEEELRRSEVRFRALIERSSDMIQVLDGECRFQFWSQSTVDALGWAAEEMAGRPVLAQIHQDDRDRVGAALATLLATPGALTRAVLRFQHKDGSWRRVESVARNLLDDPAVRGVVVNSRDVTEQRRLEEQFQQAQKLESVGRLAGGIAHDFNNLLTIILSSTEALKEQVGEHDLQSLEDVEQIHAAGERARDLTRQLLSFARKQLVAPVTLDLNSVVRANQRMLGRLLGEDVDLRVKLQAGLWSVHADPSQLDQVILNLAVNARDAMPKGGLLTIETRNRSVTGEEVQPGSDLHPGDWVQLLVQDSGAGMTAEVRSHLFEPFFTTKEQGKGTGLGLATVYGIVSQAGGHIHVASEPGWGATFQVCLPRGAGSAPQPQPQAAPASTRGTERILVVEDDALVRAAIVRMLAAEGYLVTAVSHPQHALELGPEELSRLQLVATDVVMPGMDGHSLAVELRRKAPSLRVLYLSGYTRDAITERGVTDSGAAFLAKPFTRHALLSRVRELLDGVSGD